MKKIALYLFLSALLFGCSDGNDEVIATESLVKSNFSDSDRQVITDYFLSNEEPTVLDATWTNEKTFKVGVKDDNSRRDSLASYVCMELTSQLDDKAKGVWVQIIDYPHLMKTKEWLKLGEAHC